MSARNSKYDDNTDSSAIEAESGQESQLNVKVTHSRPVDWFQKYSKDMKFIWDNRTKSRNQCYSLVGLFTQIDRTNFQCKIIFTHRFKWSHLDCRKRKLYSMRISNNRTTTECGRPEDSHRRWEKYRIGATLRTASNVAKHQRMFP